MLPYNLGLEGYVGYVLYATMWVAFLVSVFRQPSAGIYYLALLLPIQTIRYRLNAYPLGASMVSIIMIGVIIGALRQERPEPRPARNSFLYIYLAFTFISLCAGSIYLGDSVLPDFHHPRFQTWRDYVSMALLLPVTTAAITNRRQMQTLLLVMCFSGFLLDKSFWGTVSGRDFSSYSDDLRDNGAMGYAGVNGLAAFEAQFAMAVLSLAAFEEKFWMKAMYYALALFSAVCLMYSLSRAGYAAFVVGWLYLGIVKERKLLALLVAFGLTWTTLVPNAVRDRVSMTNSSGSLDHSSETRVNLWDDAIQLFNQNPVVGTGFNTYAYMSRIGNYKDTHNIYIKVLVETGAVGIVLFLLLLFSLWLKGFGLFLRSSNPVSASIGLALSCWIVCAAVANFFGDRWTFLQVNGYMWMIAGMVNRATALEDADEDEEQDEAVDTDDAELAPVAV